MGLAARKPVFGIFLLGKTRTSYHNNRLVYALVFVHNILDGLATMSICDSVVVDSLFVVCRFSPGPEV